jgi:hypothetical protein
VPGGPYQADVGVLMDPRELGEVQQQRRFRGRLGGEVEVLQRLVGGERGVTDPLARAGGVAREHLGLEQDLKELLVGPALLARPLGCLLGAVADARCLELGQQIGQPLADRRSLRAHAQSSA